MPGANSQMMDAGMNHPRPLEDHMPLFNGSVASNVGSDEERDQVQPLKDATNPKKRPLPLSAADVDAGDGTVDGVRAEKAADGSTKPVKRRASKACESCRQRKVRCDVMQRYHVSADGNVTCSNCTMDGIQCVIGESKRRKRHLQNGSTSPQPLNNGGHTEAWTHGLIDPLEISNPRPRNGSIPHIAHSIYQNANPIMKTITPQFDIASDKANQLLASASITGDLRATNKVDTPIPSQPPIHLKHVIPKFLKALPSRMTSLDIDYLFAKSALSLPDTPLQNALIRSYLEYVHPYMPLIDINSTLQIIDDPTGETGKISLLLYQSIMFSGTAFVDMEILKKAGFSTRKAARKAFFQKTRVLYDSDYEVDRVSLVQSLLLMTYWYETPDDQKDTWHWMGVAISLAHTIGLHRDPDKSNMEPSQKRLWKRIWWSCFMRDRLVALGMRRPTRVKDEDFDVPMLNVHDFELEPLPESNSILGPECALARDINLQRQMAEMCIAKAQLCLCISHVLSAQYSVLVKHQGMQNQEGSTRSSVMLFPKKLDQTDEVKDCDTELKNWLDNLPEHCRYSTSPLSNGSSSPSNGLNPIASGNRWEPIFVQKALLHMVYFTTLSALHRPQVLPSTTSTQPDSSRELQDQSRKQVRDASQQITQISSDLRERGLEKYLPTTGVTVLLPAIIIHLLDIKSANDEARQAAHHGFCQCMLVLERLRDNYASADFATQFLEAAMRKADIDIDIAMPGSNIRESAAGIDVITDSNDFGQSMHHNGVGSMHSQATPQVEGDLFQGQAVHAGNLATSIEQQDQMQAPVSTDYAYGLNGQLEQRQQMAHAPEINSLFLTAQPDVAGQSDFDFNSFMNVSDTSYWNDLEHPHGETGGIFDVVTFSEFNTRVNTPQPDVDMDGNGL